MALPKILILPFSHIGQYYPLSRGHSGKPVRLCLQVPVLVTSSQRRFYYIVYIFILALWDAFPMMQNINILFSMIGCVTIELLMDTMILLGATA